MSSLEEAITSKANIRDPDDEALVNDKCPTKCESAKAWSWKIKLLVLSVAFICGAFTQYEAAAPCLFAFYGLYLTLIYKESRIWVQWGMTVALAMSMMIASGMVVRGLTWRRAETSYAIAFGIGLALMHVAFLAASVHMRLNARWKHWGLFFVFPAILAGFYVIMGHFTPFGTQLSPGYDLIDWLSFVQIVSLLGLSGLNFTIFSLCALLVHHYVIERPGSRLSRTAGYLAVGIFVFTWTYGSIRLVAPYMYQKGVGDLAPRPQDLLRGACVVQAGGQTVEVLQQNAPDFIIWSESAGGFSEDDAPRFQSMANESNAALAVTVGNRLVFFEPGQNVPLVRFTKGNPAPFMERGVSKGDPMAFGRSAVIGDFNAAICFDFDNPEYIRSGVNSGLMLQPANVGGVAGIYAQVPAIFRAIENGATLVRCASKAVSGVWDPYGRAQLSTMRNTADVIPFQIPKRHVQIWTFYHNVGFVFDYMLIVLMGASLILFAYTFWRPKPPSAEL